MASRDFVTTPVDPTLFPSGISAAQLLQMVKGIAPETDIIWGIRQEATPDVSTYPEYETFLWLKPSTGELKFWDGDGWELVFTFPAIADASLGIEKLATTGLSPGQLIRVNVGGDAFEGIDAADLFANGSFPIVKLAAVTQGDFLFAKSSTALAAHNFEDEWSTLLDFAQLPFANIWDLAGDGEVGQVAKLAVQSGTLTFDWADQLLRANMVPTAKLKFTGGNGGDVVTLNPAKTDFVFVDPATLIQRQEIAILQCQKAAGTDAQSVLANTTDTIEITNEIVDLDGIVTLAANDFTLLPGTYEFEISLSLCSAHGEFQLQVYNVDTAAVVFARGHYQKPADNFISPLGMLAGPFVVTGSGDDTFRLRFSSKAGSSTAILGVAVDMNSQGEVYTQIKITKLA